MLKINHIKFFISTFYYSQGHSFFLSWYFCLNAQLIKSRQKILDQKLTICVNHALASQTKSALGQTTNLLLAAVLQKIQLLENTDGPHQEKRKQLDSQSHHISETLKSVKRSPNNVEFRLAKQKEKQSI